jgi:hypothetical protein
MRIVTNPDKNLVDISMVSRGCLFKFENRFFIRVHTDLVDLQVGAKVYALDISSVAGKLTYFTEDCKVHVYPNAEIHTKE